MGLTEEIRRMIESLKITSASPNHVNFVSEIDEMPDLDAAIKDAQGLDTEFIKERQDGIESVKQVKRFQQGNVGKIQKMSTKQVSNLIAFSTNPFGFITRSFFKKLFKGVGILFLIEIARQVADIILQEFFKPGRLFDVRFREQIDKQVILFLDRKEQQELKQGFKQVITTTIGGMRGATLAGQIGGSFQNPERITVDKLDQRRVVDDNIISQNAQSRSGVNSARDARSNRRSF
jgi:hypothetical protein